MGRPPRMGQLLPFLGGEELLSLWWDPVTLMQLGPSMHHRQRGQGALTWHVALPVVFPTPENTTSPGRHSYGVPRLARVHM